MGVEPTLDQEAGRATVLKTVERVFQRAPDCSRRRQARSESVISFPTVRLVTPAVATVLQQILQHVWAAKGRDGEVHGQ